MEPHCNLDLFQNIKIGTQLYISFIELCNSLDVVIAHNVADNLIPNIYDKEGDFGCIIECIKNGKFL
jgi:hypothetical protein